MSSIKTIKKPILIKNLSMVNRLNVKCPPPYFELSFNERRKVRGKKYL